MISQEIMWTVILLTVFALIILVAIITGHFWNNTEHQICSHCGGKLSFCRITLTNESGTKVYCDPHCLDQEMGIEESKK